MKKLTTLALALACASTCVWGLVACGSSEAKLTYELSEDGTYYTVTKIKMPDVDKNGNKTDLVIPAEHEGKPVKRIKGTCIGKVGRLTIPDSITYIGNNTFSGKVDTVTFGDYENAELTTHDDKIQPYSIYIGERAFADGNSTKLTIPANAYLGKECFRASKVTEVSFEGNIAVDTDGKYSFDAFAKSTALASIEMPEATVDYSLSLSGLIDTQPNDFDERTYKIPLKYAVIPACVNLDARYWSWGQIRNYDFYPPVIYYKGTGSITDNSTFMKSVKDFLTVEVSEFGKSETTFDKFIYYYSEERPTDTANKWHYNSNGAPAKW